MKVYAALLLIALACNLRNPRMLILSVVVGIGVFAPIPPSHFYLTCGLVEMCIFGIACLLNAPASLTICRISVLLVTFHILGFFLDGYPASSPYHALVQIAEHAELITCIILSHPSILKGKQWKL